MTEREDPRPIPYGLVEHVHRSKSGKTVMAISLPIETRARMAQAALDLGCSKLALVRAAINQFLIQHEESRRLGQERALAATSEVAPPVPDPEPVETSEPTVAGSEHLPVPSTGGAHGAPTAWLEPEPEPELTVVPEPAVPPMLEVAPEPAPEPVKAPRRARKERS